MTDQMRRLLDEIEQLPESDQHWLVDFLLEAAASERRWNDLFSDPRSQEALDRLAAEARTEMRARRRDRSMPRQPKRSAHPRAGRLPRRLRALLAEVRSRFEAAYGSRLAALVLFGSQARADAVRGSDIDLLVVLHGEVHPGEEIDRMGGVISALSLAYDVMLSCVFMSAQQYAAEVSPLLLNIRREGIAV